MQLFDDWLGFPVSRLWLQVYVQHFVSQFHCAKYKTLAFLKGQLLLIMLKRTKVLQNVLSLIGFFSFIPGVF